jgi:predicted nuclease of predicted toxin-antitoxin system
MMSKFLANENVPIEVVEAARLAGLDLTWIKDLSRAADDDDVLALGCSESRVLLTFDKDFGEMAFRQGKTSVAGVILLRLRLRDPDYLARFAKALLLQPVIWEGHFCVAREGRMRMVPLPE